MGWVKGLHGQTVGLDTAPLIFYIEDHPVYADRLEPFFQSVRSGDITIVTSVLTLLEVLVHPLRRKDEALAHRYNDILLSSPNILTLPVDAAIAQLASELRSSARLKTPDAVQVATALSRSAAAFLTNDRDFHSVSALQVLRVSDLGEEDS